MSTEETNTPENQDDIAFIRPADAELIELYRREFDALKTRFSEHSEAEVTARVDALTVSFEQAGLLAMCEKRDLVPRDYVNGDPLVALRILKEDCEILRQRMVRDRGDGTNPATDTAYPVILHVECMLLGGLFDHLRNKKATTPEPTGETGNPPKKKRGRPKKVKP